MRPFKVIFKTDSNELTTTIGSSDTNEEAGFPGGIIGFQLFYNQVNNIIVLARESQALLSEFSLLAEFYSEKVQVKG